MKVDIDSQTAEKLKTLGAINGTSPEELVRQIVSVSITRDKRYWQEYEEDKASLEAMKNGDYINNDDMMNWLDDLDAGKDVQD